MRSDPKCMVQDGCDLFFILFKPHLLLRLLRFLPKILCSISNSECETDEKRNFMWRFFVSRDIVIVLFCSRKWGYLYMFFFWTFSLFFSRKKTVFIVDLWMLTSLRRSLSLCLSRSSSENERMNVIGGNSSWVPHQMKTSFIYAEIRMWEWEDERERRKLSSRGDMKERMLVNFLHVISYTRNPHSIQLYMIHTNAHSHTYTDPKWEIWISIQTIS